MGLADTVQNIEIPVRPEILDRLDAEVAKDDPDIRKIETLIGEDAGISASLIKTVNSPFYGSRSSATSVHKAVSMLGLDTVSRIVSGLALRKIAGSSNADLVDRMLKDSADLALVSGYLAKRMGSAAPDQAFTFGLFQNCGILLLARFKDYGEVFASSVGADRRLVEIEFEQYRFTHAHAGALMAKSWRLSDSVAEAVRYHHDYEMISDQSGRISPESRDLIGLAFLAEWAIRYRAGFDKTAEWQAGAPFAMAHFGCHEEGFGAIAEEVQGLLGEDR